MLLPRKKKDLHNTPPKRLAVELMQENRNTDMHGNLQKKTVLTPHARVSQDASNRPSIHRLHNAYTRTQFLFFPLFLQQSRIK